MKNQQTGLIKFRYILLLLVTIFMGFMLFVAVSISDRYPLVVEMAELDASAAQSAKQFVNRVRHQIASQTESTTLQVNIDELNGLAALANRAFPRIKGRVNISPWEMITAVTLHLPENPFGDFINIRFGVEPSTYGFNLTGVNVGELEFSGHSVLGIAEFFMNQLLGNALGSQIINGIDEVSIDGDDIHITLQPISSLKERVTLLRKRLAVIRDDIKLFSDPDIVRLYYAHLCEVGRQYQGFEHVSAVYYIQPVFSMAQYRSLIETNTINENQAALIALGLYLGSRRFEPFIGKIHTEEIEPCQAESRASEFAGRHDLVLHFFYSAMIKILTDSGVSFAAGEFKELLDTAKKRGGVSFSDIAADMAGIRLVEELLDPGVARRAQRRLSQELEESLFFPDIAGLPDNISKEQFEQDYGGLDDPRYQSMLGKIEQRLERLPLYANP